MTKTASVTDIERALADLETEGRRRALRAVRLTDRGHILQGILLLRQDTSTTNLAEAVRTAAGELGLTGPLGGESCPTRPSGVPLLDDSLKAIIQQEIERSRETRLPCALMLIGLPTADGLPELMTAALSQEDPLGYLGLDTLAVLLDGCGHGRARARAFAICRRLRQASEAAVCSPDFGIGIGVCTAEDRCTADELIETAGRELSRAKNLTTDPIALSAPAAGHDACQVTVEERTQLFSLLTKETA